MEDFCDRIPGQHTGRLSLEHQAREAADWQQKVDDLQKQLDSANRIIRIKDESISLLEKRCNNLREELDELSDRVAVLHDRIIEQNNAIRNAVKASPAAGGPELRTLSPGDHSETLGTPPATPSAAEAFRKALGADSSWAWSWHCNIAMPLQDNGMSHEKANCCAADLMLHLFDIDVTSFDEWKSFPWATPSAAVGADGPGDDVTEWCDGAKEFCERQVESDTVPRAEYDRVVKLNHHLREAAVMAISERVPSDSKPTNFHNPESEDTPPRGNDAPATGKPFQLEHGKQYLRRDGKVSGVMTQTKGGEYSVSHPLWDDFHCLSYRPDGRYNVSEAEDKFDLISEYHEPEPIPPAESEVDRLQRELDAAVEYHDNYTSKIDKALGQPRHGGDLLTEHLREIERLKALSATTYPPAESPDDWVMITDPKHDARQCDECRYQKVIHRKKIQYDWAPCCGLIGCRIGDYPDWEFRCRRKDLPPVPVVPKTRTVTLREYTTDGEVFWTTNPNVRTTGRTCEVEVPE